MAIGNMQKTKAKGKTPDKDSIRREYLAKRNAMPLTLVRSLSDEICDFVLGWDVYQHAQTMFFYYPLGNEVSLLPVIRDALKSGRHVAFPKTVRDTMEFYEISDLGELEVGRFHVMEPTIASKQPFQAEPELCFVPGVVFDDAGGRFGYGKGYYDRYFAARKTVKLVGCAYQCQMADRLPTDAWDIRMDLLLSEQGIRKIPSPVPASGYL